MLFSLFLSVYVSVIVCFSFVSHPLYYCVLLLVSSISVCGAAYTLLGFGWYLILFGLVYVGGVYILFLFVSVFSPNTAVGYQIKWYYLFLVFIFCFFIFFCSFFSVGLLNVFNDSSNYLCSSVEGLSYVVFCLVLSLGFSCVTLVVNRKDSFYR